MLIALLAAFSQAATLIGEKWILSKERVSRRDFIPLTFLVLFLGSGLLSLVFGWVDPAFFSRRGLLLMGAIVLLAGSWNLLYYRALQAERASAVENVLILSPLAIILLDWAVHPELFALGTFAVAGLGVVVLLWGYSRPEGLIFDRYLVLLFAAVLLLAGESLAIATLLQEQLISPISLFAIRTGVLAGVFWAFFRPKVSRMNRRHLRDVTALAIFGIAMMLLRFYSFRDAGLVVTGVAFLFVPVLVYAGSATVLGERLRGRMVEAGLLMTALVILGLGLT